MPGRFKFFECSTPKCTVTYTVSYTCRQTHSQNGALEKYESRDRGSNQVTEKTTLVIARLQSVNTKPSESLKLGNIIFPLNLRKNVKLPAKIKSLSVSLLKVYLIFSP
jgi:hypothetical protein